MKVALIVGSSRGIGAGIAQYLLGKGYFVYVTYSTGKDSAMSLFKDNNRCKIVKLTLPIQVDIDNVHKMITKNHGKLDLLVNSSVVEHPGTTEEITIDNWRELYEVGLFGRFQTSKTFLPLLAVTKGVIVNISSALAYRAQPEYPIYASLQAAITNYTKSCALDFAKYGIRCHTVNPGAVRTDLCKVLGIYDDDNYWIKKKETNPLHHVCTPEDVGKAVYLLTLPEAEYLNGEEIYVNGGSHLQ